MRGGGYQFSQVPTAEIPRSTFNRSHGHKTTFDSGYLVPFFLDEALPGDTFKVDASLFARLTTPLTPFMDNLYLDVFWFAVPNRLLWSHWEQFCGADADGVNPNNYVIPTIDWDGLGADVGSIADYFGIPTNKSLPDNITALPFRAYNLIFNEWFRDQNMVSKAVQNVDDGPDDATDFELLKRGKRHDYFTSCLPWPQKGPGVQLPLGATAPVIPDPDNSTIQMSSQQEANQTLQYRTSPHRLMIGTITDQETAQWGEQTGLVADLSSATAATINSLREAFQIQKLLERDARGGTRYVEVLKSHFGVVSPDFRLQRPEFLGGGTVNVHVNPVAQTSNTPASGTPQGNLAAYAVAAGGGIGFSKSFVEHSFIMGILCARADLSYQQGLPRMFTRATRYDFYWPAFAHLGEQAVLNREIFYAQDPSDDNVFGYQERWAEYRYHPSKITGLFRSDAVGSLDSWHLAQDFQNCPQLNAEFIQEDPPVARVLAIQSVPQFLLDSHIRMQCTRPMPMYSVPGLIDHF